MSEHTFRAAHGPAEIVVMIFSDDPAVVEKATSKLAWVLTKVGFRPVHKVHGSDPKSDYLVLPEGSFSEPSDAG